ncbi:cell division protein FtsB [Methylophilaceae bacterium]|jgi:cell division protein FtsB|nr:cell division protein FtsB [Methylophilaceae bacterium]MDC0626824.1 cell division protein FtsB [Methylophilaceae bacterium]NCV38206.1 cell division protein FtsB [Betaproteobacteria bacterium]NCW63105.1 cell division protein FtsB [Betaproteobacteria bacterium]
MKFLTFIFITLILALQYPLWFGKGGWLNVISLQKQIDQQLKVNEAIKSENDILLAVVQDLKNGTDVIEGKARFDLGLIKKNETFFLIIDKKN